MTYSMQSRALATPREKDKLGAFPGRTRELMTAELGGLLAHAVLTPARLSLGDGAII